MNDIVIPGHGIKGNYPSANNANSGCKGGCCKGCCKKADDIGVKFEEADASFKLFKSGAKMLHEAWFDIVNFLVTLYNNFFKPSKLNSV